MCGELIGYLNTLACPLCGRTAGASQHGHGPAARGGICHCGELSITMAVVPVMCCALVSAVEFLRGLGSCSCLKGGDLDEAYSHVSSLYLKGFITRSMRTIFKKQQFTESAVHV